MSVETFFNYKNFRWMWWNVFGILILTVLYVVYRPPEGAHGSTYYGYTVGILGALGIAYLMWYGIRKRSYQTHRTTLKGWLSAHVWLGLSLVIVVPLHAGFEFSWNVHTLAYVLMVITVASGIWGALAYQTLAPQIEAHRGGGSLENLVEQFHLNNQGLDSLSQGKSDSFLVLRNEVEVSLRPYLLLLLLKDIRPGPSAELLTEHLRRLPEAEREDAINMIKICEKKRGLARTIQREVRLTAKIRLWLLLHLPISFALLAALVIHIVVVLLYR